MHLTTGFPTYLYSFQTENVRIVCPIAEREFAGYIDIVTPYGFSGFVGTGNYADFPQYWRVFAQERGYVCGYIGLNPIFENRRYFDSSDLYSYNNIYILDLTVGLDELYSKLSTNRKRQLKDWGKTSAGLLLTQRPLKDFFIANYAKFFRQKKAASVYGFSAATLERLFESNNMVMVGAGTSRAVEAVTVFAYTSHVADFLFNVSLPQGRRYSAALIWYCVNYFKSIGIPTLNLGGGVRADDSLAEFKQRFGARKLMLNCLKQVYDPSNYAVLCARVGADPVDRTGYFPAFRAAMEGRSMAPTQSECIK
jgi:hypothetical protein